MPLHSTSKLPLLPQQLLSLQSYYNNLVVWRCLTLPEKEDVILFVAPFLISNGHPKIHQYLGRLL